MRKDIAFGGVSRSPGGATSADGDLMGAVNMCNDGAGLEMLEKPQKLFTLDRGETFLCIHEPEDESRHYITQLVVVGDGGTLDPEEDEQPVGGIEPGLTTQVLDHDLYLEDTPTSPPGNNSSNEGNGQESVVPYTPPEGATSANIADFTALENLNPDSGGTTITPDPNDPLEGGIYLCWWAENNGEYTRRQIIDITPYGEVTSAQPMGNTIICNHEGGEDFPKEIRYWLWKGADQVYVGLGSKPPMIDITFGLESTFEYYPRTESKFDNDSNPTKYKRYGGVTISSYPYTDTVPLWWAGYESGSYVPPYYFYKDGEYTPDPHASADTDVFSHWQSTYSLDGVESPDGKTDVAGMKANWTTMALGAYNKFIAEQTKENKFVFPFYARYAIELYDGSLMMHSYPVLLIPNSRGPIFALDGRKGLKADLDDAGHSYEKVRIEFKGRVYGFSSKLMYDLKALAAEDLARLQNWKDLIRGVNIYITPPIYNYKQGGQVLGWRCMDWRDPANDDSDIVNNPWDKYYTIGKVKYKDSQDVEHEASGLYLLSNGFSTILPSKGDVASNKIFWPWVGVVDNDATTFLMPDYILSIPQKEDEEIMELHENAGQFYKLASIEYEKLLEMAETAQGEKEVTTAGKKVLATIANQDIMQDDNGSHDTLSADVLYGYNRRLNMAGVKKKMHSPLKPSVMWARDYSKFNGDYVNYPYQVSIYAKNGAEIAKLKVTEASVNTSFPQNIFYPNPDAFEAVIVRSTSQGNEKYKIRLKEHKALNGAFWVGQFFNNALEFEKYKLANNATTAELQSSEVGNVVNEKNKIYTTETDNPFAVPFGNINIAGGGIVKALAAATQAMSQGQFGQFPLYCFTTEGVWAMTVNDTGGWATIQPMTRDVIADGTMPLSLDSTVVFMSDRGLLQLAGAEVKILSEPLMNTDLTLEGALSRRTAIMTALGEDFATMDTVISSLNVFPRKNVNLAYDAKNARIYVTERNCPSWVYNLKSGLWTQATTHIDRQVVSYPECLTQQGQDIVTIGDLGDLPTRRYTSGLILTRPIKLGDMGVLKKWHEMMVRGHESPYNYGWGKGDVQTALWGSRDFLTYALVGTSTLPRLTRRGGSPYFAHCVMVAVRAENETASSPLFNVWINGMDIEMTTEQTNKLR